MHSNLLSVLSVLNPLGPGRRRAGHVLVVCWLAFFAMAQVSLAPALLAQERIQVDSTSVIKKEVQAGAAGLNLCWLLDSDLRRPKTPSMSEVLATMRVGALRFPYGHLADNYLWHTPPYENVKGGLRPRVATMRDNPGRWSWAVNADGSFKAAMDFDEYLALCSEHSIKPLVCVNALSWKYPGGPTYQTLKESAIAWVRYDKGKSYRVAYWQIGNEVDHHRDILPMEDYVTLYRDFAAAMKSVDPSIQVGPGVLQAANYYEALMRACPDLIDFVSAHQYVHGAQKKCADYAGWRDAPDAFIHSLGNAERGMKAAGGKTAPILVTETGVTGPSSMGVINNTYKALWWFEMLMNELSHPLVKYTFYWGTHSPWNYGGEDREPRGDVGVALRLKDNARTPTGAIIELVNGHLLDDFVASNRVAGRVRSYAMVSKDRSRMMLFLLNKDEAPREIRVVFKGANPKRLLSEREFSGSAPDDRMPTLKQRSGFRLDETGASVSLAPLSVSLFEFGTR